MSKFFNLDEMLNRAEDDQLASVTPVEMTEAVLDVIINDADMMEVERCAAEMELSSLATTLDGLMAFQGQVNLLIENQDAPYFLEQAATVAAMFGTDMVAEDASKDAAKEKTVDKMKDKLSKGAAFVSSMIEKIKEVLLKFFVEKLSKASSYRVSATKLAVMLKDAKVEKDGEDYEGPKLGKDPICASLLKLIGPAAISDLFTKAADAATGDNPEEAALNFFRNAVKKINLPTGLDVTPSKSDKFEFEVSLVEGAEKFTAKAADLKANQALATDTTVALKTLVDHSTTLSKKLPVMEMLTAKVKEEESKGATKNEKLLAVYRKLAVGQQAAYRASYTAITAVAAAQIKVAAGYAKATKAAAKPAKAEEKK